MRKRFRIGFGILLVAILGGFAWLVLRPVEPVYQGRTLTSWLERATYDFGTPYPSQAEIIRNESKLAVQQIGTNALSYLLMMASSHDSELKSNLVVLAHRVIPIPIHRYSCEESRTMAIFGFYSLGPAGKSAVPSLLELLNSRYWELRCSAAECLGNVGPEAKEAVPLLISLLNDSNRIVRWDAILNLGRIHSRPELVLPILLKNLNTSNEVITTIYVLGDFGEAAKPAVPALLPYLNDHEEYVRDAATNALKQIDPEAAAKAGIK